MKKNVILKSIEVLLLGILVGVVLIAGVKVRAKQIIGLQTVYIAGHDIAPRTRIREEDLLEIQIPEAYLVPNAAREKAEIVGRYTDIQGKIPAGSLFYKSMLYGEKELPDNPTAQLKEGQSTFTMETDLARLGGALSPGQRVDIYASVTAKDGTVVTGAVVENARLLALKDHNGLDLEDENSTGTPYLAILAVSSDDLQYLSAIAETGSLRLFSSSRSYDPDLEAVLIKDSPVIQCLNSQQADVQGTGYAE